MAKLDSDIHRTAYDKFLETACGPDAATAPLGDLDNPVQSVRSETFPLRRAQGSR